MHVRVCVCVCSYLCVRAALPVTLVADEHVRLSTPDLGQLMLSDGLFSQSLSHLLQLCTRHLLHMHSHTFVLYLLSLTQYLTLNLKPEP